ncbi:MAG TPA: TadE/TadG family type IV pilus assembly protein [Terriglobia bacterium]|nr:TadE/TadG family type IV pilus assembly protein [Terriglobia bacterium]
MRLLTTKHGSQSKRRSGTGSQIVELAVMLPLFLVFTVATFDFGHVFTVRDKLANAAREGARQGAGQSFSNLVTGPGSSGPPSTDITAVAQSVYNYLLDTNVLATNGKNCVLNAGVNVSAFAWQFTATNCPDTLTIKIERADAQVVNGGTAIMTRVTVNYPARFLLFHQVIRLIAQGANFSSTYQISAVGTMQNITN